MYENASRYPEFDYFTKVTPSGKYFAYMLTYA